MVKLYTVKEMHDVEVEADSSGLTYAMMMENAGKSLADEIKAAYGHLTNKNVLALVGSGNNGGDALVALSFLAEDQWRGFAYIVKTRPDDDPLIRRFTEKCGKVFLAGEDDRFQTLGKLLEQCSIVVDGVFGTGIKLPLHGDAASVLSFCKDKIASQASKINVVAVDCPSGVDCETGDAADETIPADMTVTMAGLKSGMVNPPAIKYLGLLHIGNIGDITILNSYLQNKKIILSKEIVREYLPERPADSHKGTFGTALIIAGSVNYSGAALLSGKAAYKVGAGLVTTAVPAPLHAALAGQFPESTWILLPNELGVISQDAVRIVKQNLDRPTALLIGPGFGLEDPTKEFIRGLLENTSGEGFGKIGFIHNSESDHPENILKKPLVFDADGLKLLSKVENWPALLPANTVLTPHPGEMSVLTGLPIGEIQSNRMNIAQEYAHQWGHVIVLKSAYTIIASPDGRLAVVPVASSALARAGSGDVLAGLIVGLRAQGVAAFEAASAAAWIHAHAGLLAADYYGNTASVLAGDLLNFVPDVLRSLQ
jgi:hydroxyethylthiazole kinase-like uncharacterized protein yjeF